MSPTMSSRKNREIHRMKWNNQSVLPAVVEASGGNQKVPSVVAQ
jgi:hypothetical protein